MTEALGIYRVKSGRIIFHEGQSYVGGSVLGLPIDVANIHSTNIDLIPEPDVDDVEVEPDEVEPDEVEPDEVEPDEVEPDVVQAKSTKKRRGKTSEP